MGSKMQDSYQQSAEKRKKKKRKAYLGAAAAVLAAAAVILGVWFGTADARMEKRYAEYIAEGNRCLIQLDYEAAELVFQRAAEEVPEKTEAYEKLAGIYIAQSRYAEAEELLVRGIRCTNADVLVKTYQRVSQLLQDAQRAEISAENITAEELIRISEGLTLDSTVFDVVASYTYRDYVRAYGEPVFSEENDYGGRDVRFDGFAGTVSFRNRSYGEKLADAVTFESVSDLLGNYGGAASAEKLKELFGSEMDLEAASGETGNEYHVSFAYHGCIITLESDRDGNIYGNADNVLAPDPEALGDSDGADEEGKRTASGYIVNAVNGGGVTASLRFLSGGRYGNVEQETSARSDGSFEVKLQPGQYTVEIRATGFITSYEEIQVVSGTDLKGLSFTLSPELETGEIRIVLTWGEAPRDLDSHLDGTDSQGGNVSISYRNLKKEGVASLDLDDTTGFGPETTTIYDSGGSYLFSVHNYSANYDSATLEQSGAVVKVYLSGQAEPSVYQVPSGDGIWWDVFRIENGEVTAVNTLR